MLSSEVGAVQPVAVTSRSQSILVPSRELDRLTARGRRDAATMPGRARASTTRATSTPARRRSRRPRRRRGWRSAPPPARPGLTAYRLISRRTAVTSITPGRSLPAKTYGRSISPGATTRASRAGLDQPLGPPGASPDTLHHRRPVAVVAAGHHRVGEHLDARRWPRPGRRSSASAASSAPSPQRRWPPRPCSSSTSMTARAGLRGRDGGRHPGRAAAGDQHVGVRVPLVE